MHQTSVIVRFLPSVEVDFLRFRDRGIADGLDGGVVFLSNSSGSQGGTRLLIIGHSLIDHRPSAIPTPGHETTVPHTMYLTEHKLNGSLGIQKILKGQWTAHF